MTTPDASVPDRVLERLYRRLAVRLPLRCVRPCEASPFRTGTESPRCERAQSALRMEGEKSPLRAESTASRAGKTTHDPRRVAVDGSRTRNPTCASPTETQDRKMKEADPSVATVLLDESERKRDDVPADPLLSEVPPHVPMLVLSKDGMIQDLTGGTRRLLEYCPDTAIEPYFFSHVHGQNLRRVMRDLAQIASRTKQRARWLLRLRTGRHRWRWYRIRAKRIPGPSNSLARLLLRRL